MKINVSIWNVPLITMVALIVVFVGDHTMFSRPDAALLLVLLVALAIGMYIGLALLMLAGMIGAIGRNTGGRR